MMKVVPSMTSGRDKLREKPNKDNTPRSPGKALINSSLPNRNNKSNVKQVHTKKIINNNSDTDNDDDIEVILHKVYSAFEKNTLTDKFVSSLDLLSNKTTPDLNLPFQAEHSPKTIIGATCTILVYSLWIASAIYFLVWQLYGKENVEITLGEEMRGRLNHRDCFNPKLDINDPRNTLAEPIVSLPTLKLQIHSHIKMYEELTDSTPSLQNIEVIDNLGYTNVYGSSSSKAEGVNSADQGGKVKSLYMKSKAFLNSWDDSISLNLPSRGGLHSNIQNAIARSKTHQFPSETMKSAYLQGQVFEGKTNLTNHTTHLFVRLKEDQVMKLKPCQLQIWMVNSGEYEVLKKFKLLKEEANHKLLTSRTIDTSLWEQDSFIRIPSTSTNKWKYTLTAKEKQAIINDEQNQINALPTYSINLIHLQKQYLVSDKMNFFANAKKIMGNNKLWVDFMKMPIKERQQINQKFNSWNFGVSYNKNLKRIVEDWECDGEKCMFNPEDGSEYVFAEPFSKTESTITIITSRTAKIVQELGWSSTWTNTPLWKNIVPEFFDPLRICKN